MTLDFAQTNSEANQAEPGTEHLLSRLLMGFVDRNISPHTIADVVRTQVLDAHVPSTVLSPITCNGIIEVVATTSQSPSDLETLLFLTSRPDFPEFLSPKASAGIIVYLLKQITANETKYLEPSRKHRINAALEHASRRAISTGYPAQSTYGERTRLLSVMRTIPSETRIRLATESPTLELLRQACSEDTATPAPALRSVTSMNMTPEEILRAILTLPDHTLAQKGIVHFRGSSPETLLTWKVQSCDRIVNELTAGTLSHFKRGFLTEWTFDGVLRETQNKETLTEILYKMVERFLSLFGNDDAVPKGILRALQRDASLAAMEQDFPNVKSSKVEALLQRASHFSLLLLPTASANISQFSRQFASWALQIPVQPAESRIFTRSAWQWMRVILSGTWEDDLKTPPGWIVTHSSRFCAPIFRDAPAFWLQEYAPLLIERLLMESAHPAFQPSAQQTDYVEFLCRTLRKKSPLYASRSEPLLALKLLGRATLQEEGLVSLARTRAKMGCDKRAISEQEREFWQAFETQDESSERFGSNVITRALNVLLYTARIIAKTGHRGVGLNL